MATDIKQPSGDQKVQKRHKEPKAQPVEIYKPRRWPANLIFGVGGVVAVGGFAWLVWASSTFAEIVDPIKFITEGCFALFLIAVAIAQVGLYWSQRDYMNAQWNVMERSLGRTDSVIEQMELQLQETIAQRILSDQSMKVSQRAYVAVLNPILGNPPLAVPKAAITILIGNTGATPARDVNVKAYRAYSDKPPKESALDYAQLDDLTSQAVLWRGAEPLVISLESKEFVSEVERFTYLTVHRLYVWGKITYFDVFGDFHTTKFCFVNIDPRVATLKLYRIHNSFD